MSGRKAAAGLAACAAVLVAAAVFAGAPRAGRVDAAGGLGVHGAHHTDEAMRAEAQAYWARHDPVGANAGAVTGGPAATITVGNFFFEAGAPSQVDTARILVGQSVLWLWAAGFHTITSGTGSGDPNAGLLFNRPSDTSNQQFEFTFSSAGVFPYFCSFHELQNMRGYVEVSEPADVPPGAGGARLGFTRDPAPNPTRSGVTFSYALADPGRVRAVVFDAGGRRVAVLADRVMPAGTHGAGWDGRTPAGLAGTGVYYIRLRLPGYDQSRRVVIRH
jgi:plastocyanin